MPVTRCNNDKEIANSNNEEEFPSQPDRLLVVHQLHQQKISEVDRSGTQTTEKTCVSNNREMTSHLESGKPRQLEGPSTLNRKSRDMLR
jgi:hypothetical protein